MGLDASKEIKLTKEELNDIQRIWKLVMKDAEETGCYIFKTFLDKHNYYFKFHKLLGVPPSEMMGNKLFRRHAISIVHEINKVVLHVGNDATIKERLIQLGKFHGKRRVSEDQFMELKVVILDVLVKNFNASDSAIMAWNKTFDVAYGFIFEGMKEGV